MHVVRDLEHRSLEVVELLLHDFGWRHPANELPPDPGDGVRLGLARSGEQVAHVGEVVISDRNRNEFGVGAKRVDLRPLKILPSLKHVDRRSAATAHVGQVQVALGGHEVSVVHNRPVAHDRCVGIDGDDSWPSAERTAEGHVFRSASRRPMCVMDKPTDPSLMPTLLGRRLEPRPKSIFSAHQALCPLFILQA